MGKQSTRANHLKVIQGGKAKAVKSTKALTHKDIKEFLAKFAEAILVDQERVDKLPHKKFHPLYDDGMWRRYREDYVCVIIDLSMTVDEMPKRLLKKLTELAIAYNPEVVKKSLRNMISYQTNGGPDEASVFFGDLIAEVSQHDPGISPRGNPIRTISRWFDYDDPIRIARDSECQYVDLLASHIERESERTRRSLAVQARLAFVEKRAAKEFMDYLTFSDEGRRWWKLERRLMAQLRRTTGQPAQISPRPSAIAVRAHERTHDCRVRSRDDHAGRSRRARAPREAFASSRRLRATASDRRRGGYGQG